IGTGIWSARSRIDSRIPRLKETRRRREERFSRSRLNKDASARALQLDRAGAADDGFGSVGLVAPHFDFGACAYSLGPSSNDQSFRPGDVVAPQHVDQAQI